MTCCGVATTTCPIGIKGRGLTSVQAFLERRELTCWCCVVWCRWTCLIVTMTAAYLLLCCVAVVLPLMAVSGENVRLMEWQKMQDAWSQWKKQHGKVYSNFREEVYRHHVFYQNLGEILAHNAQYPVSVSYTRGLNQFSDMTVEEYRVYNQLQPRSHLSSVCHDTHRAVANSPLPATVDWRTKGYVTAVKNQGQCGSCWAFSTTGSVEGQHFKQTGYLLSLSEQQLVDCSQAEGNDGCNGGLMDNGFKYIMSQPGGLETEQEYPYQAMDGHCKAVPSEEKAKVSGCVDVTSEDEGALQHATALVGPISVAIDASHDSFQSYSGGVYYEPQCSSTQLDHGVLVVGYGTYQGQDYWLVKNSWGADWGMNGYIMMARNQNNMCGIASMASYPTV